MKLRLTFQLVALIVLSGPGRAQEKAEEKEESSAPRASEPSSEEAREDGEIQGIPGSERKLRLLFVYLDGFIPFGQFFNTEKVQNFGVEVQFWF